MQIDILERLEKIENKIGFLDFFRDIKDHRVERNKLHQVDEIIFLAFCGYIANCNSWEDIETFGKQKIEFLRNFLPYGNGIPSDDTLRRFFRVLEPTVFERKFEDWIKYIIESKVEKKLIAIDGKVSRGSKDANNDAIHTVSAFASEERLTLAQRNVDCKTNEIKAIPELLDAIDISGSIITIDAMGTQYAIANKIVSKEADYILALKGNQKTLENDVIEVFNHVGELKQINIHEDHNKEHGRLESRICTVIADQQWIKWLTSEHNKWSTIKSVIRIISTRTIKGVTTEEARFYIASISMSAKQTLNAIRSHWSIENSLHWVLDVTFGDDQSRVRKGNAPQNMLILKKAALNLLQMIKTQFPRIDGVRTSIARLRKMAGWVEDWLLRILVAKPVLVAG